VHEIILVVTDRQCWCS